MARHSGALGDPNPHAIFALVQEECGSVFEALAADTPGSARTIVRAHRHSAAVQKKAKTRRSGAAEAD